MVWGGIKALISIENPCVFIFHIYTLTDYKIIANPTYPQFANVCKQKREPLRLSN